MRKIGFKSMYMQTDVCRKDVKRRMTVFIIRLLQRQLDGSCDENGGEIVEIYTNIKKILLKVECKIAIIVI